MGLFEWKKKEIITGGKMFASGIGDQTYAPQTEIMTSVTDVFSPTTSYAYQGGDVIISSPHASTKKEQASTQIPKFDFGDMAQGMEGGVSKKGGDLTTILALGGIGIAAVYLLGSKKTGSKIIGKVIK